ncbi:TPA: DUF4062 domain-containing protein [Acinetobacter baumannii]|nr:DUF4062 domain-containing protein [Acinetobacter baumannii]
MNQRKKYQIFVSSTYVDLIAVRNKLITRLIKEGYIVIGMEDFFSRPYSQWEHIEREISESDYYVLVLGHRYGSLDEETQISYTEKEFHYAKTIGVPILVFDLSKKFEGLDVDHFEDDPEKLAKLQKFRKTAHGLLGTVALSNQSDLEQSVVTSVNNAVRDNKRPGWIRAGSNDIERENLELKSKIVSLERLLQINSNTPINMPEFEFILEIPSIHPLPEKNDPLVRNELLIKDIPHILKPYLDENEVSNYNNKIPTQEQLNQNSQINYLLECLDNIYPIKIEIGNIGNKKANDVRALIFFPDFIRVFDSKWEYDQFIKNLKLQEVKLPSNPLKEAEIAYERSRISSLFNISGMIKNQSLISGTVSLSSPAYDMPRISTSRDDKNHEMTRQLSTQISIKRESIYHSESGRYINDEDFFIAPMYPGEGEIKVSLISEELDKELIYTFPIKVV